MIKYLKIVLISLCYMLFSNCNHPPQEELQMENYYTFDSNFSNTPSIIIHNDTLMFLENESVENVYFKAVDIKTNQVFQSVFFEEGYSLGYANYDSFRNSYIFPIQLNKLVQQNVNGATKILELEGNFKFNPLVYGNLIFFQERGYCVKVVSADDFDVKWTYPIPNFSISQPLLIGENVIFLLPDNTLISCDFATGKENWRYKSNSGLHIGDIYGNSQEQVFILTTDLKDNIEVEAIDINNGKSITRKKLKEPIDVWNTSNVIIGNKIYCKGYDKVFVYDLASFEKLKEFHFKGLLNTKLIKYKNKILFSTDNEKKLFYIDNKELKGVQSKIKIQDIIVNSNDIYLFAYPQLYKVKSNFIK